MTQNRIVKNYCDHALVTHFMGILRDRNTRKTEFSTALNQLSLLLATLASQNLTSVSLSIDTPVASTTAHRIVDFPILIPILRAGLGLLSGFQTLLPESPIGHIGVERDEKTLSPRFYYYKTPPLRGRHVWLIDPMLATGGSIEFALEKILLEKPQSISAITVMASPEGLARLHDRYPTLVIHTASIEERLNEHGYIVPGLGDAGDRYFGTLV